MLYNRACAYARIGESGSETAQKQVWFEKAMADLKQVYPIDLVVGPELPGNFRNDIKPGKDLYCLSIDDRWKAEIEEIRKRLPAEV